MQTALENSIIVIHAMNLVILAMEILFQKKQLIARNVLLKKDITHMKKMKLFA